MVKYPDAVIHKSLLPGDQTLPGCISSTSKIPALGIGNLLRGNYIIFIHQVSLPVNVTYFPNC